MRIELSSVMLANQEDALRFYTDVLGFEKKADIAAGDFRWLTVVSPERPGGTQLLLEPNSNPAAAYQHALFESGIPLTSFAVDDVESEYQRLKALGMVFTTTPTDVGGAMIAMFDDTCGNHIQIHQVLEA